MISFYKLKKKLLYEKILPKPFNNFKFVNIDQINQNEFLKLINYKRVRSFFNNTKKITKKEHKKYLENYSIEPIINFYLIEKKTKKLVGVFNLKKTNIGFEIGKFILNKNYLGKGIAKKASEHVIDFFFKNLGQKAIYAKTKSNNLVNLILNIKLGFIIKNYNKKFITMELTHVRFYNLHFKAK